MCDTKTDTIRVVSPTGDTRVLSQNGDTDGSDGRLDQPAEVLLRNNKRYISNFDVPQAGSPPYNSFNTNSNPQTPYFSNTMAGGTLP